MMAHDCKYQYYRVLSFQNSVMLITKERIVENLGIRPSPLDFNCLRVSLIVIKGGGGGRGGRVEPGEAMHARAVLPNTSE